MVWSRLYWSSDTHLFIYNSLVRFSLRIPHTVVYRKKCVQAQVWFRCSLYLAVNGRNPGTTHVSCMCPPGRDLEEFRHRDYPCST
ncbi:hypothetical protein PISMIDRAFT_646008 [Pisolithus microcarpus 441]|uniref:Uncharacterized protein n=1 Tax=Pisolithus microcarpus 441 TaxID=765257 RepID=A0A0C9YHH7_9AGAM|nr:hypothetical protein PISMIDRAFT_646008 [Pisolithus microcarpus 441]